ncbi:nucleoside recognition domain-containing protein [Aliikangiella sp. G2MR2-5]|uniref:nucleoside recognition domain-containing protein n=1 Tax=Aliikangiella sp. G2MR2-5 TaxID=2788943 RepID=UPI0018AC0B7B|nr:spore maturation protein [Aliikangiella sp. G2MR2-5]
MLNKLWLSFFVTAFVAACYQWLFLSDFDVFNRIVNSLFSMSQLSVEIAIGLIGVLAFWSGILKLAELSGLAEKLARIMAPLFAKLMPEVPKGHPALGYVTMNMASNMLGLDNAATPVGLKAMQSLQRLNPVKDTASNAQILFLVLNTSSVTIFPVTIIMYRLQQGATSPAEVFLPILLATLCSTLAGLLAVSVVQKLNLLNRVVAFYGLVVGALVALGVYWLSALQSEEMAQVSSALGNGLLFTTIIVILIAAYRKGVEIYDGFVDGAKEGFEIAVKIIPFMVAMLTAIGALRASGILGGIVSAMSWLMEAVGLDPRFVEALPTALMRPFSASGSRAMMLETMSTHGVDSFVAKIAAVMQGSTETTFYVLTVYFGAVGIKKVRHAIGCGLFADLTGIVMAILVSYWFFSQG